VLITLQSPPRFENREDREAIFFPICHLSTAMRFAYQRLLEGRRATRSSKIFPLFSFSP